MATLIKFWGAETGSLNEMTNPLSGTSIDTTVSSNTGGSRSFKVDGTQTTNSQFGSTLGIAYNATTVFTFRMRFVSASTPASDFAWRTPVTLFDSSSNLMGQLFCYHASSDGSLHYKLLDSSSSQVFDVSLSGWTSGDWMDVKLVLSNSTYALTVNGTSMASGSTTIWTTTNNITYMAGLSTGTSDSNRPMWLDDICVFTGDDGWPTTTLPIVIARQFGANGSTYNSWTGITGGSTKYGNVSETPYSATNNVSSAVANQVQCFVPNTFGSTESGKGNGTITSAQNFYGATLFGVLKTSSATSNGNLFKFRWRVNGSDTDYSLTTLTTSDKLFSPMITASGSGGNFTPATVALMDAGEYGIHHDLSTRTKTLQDLWIVAVYRATDNKTLSAGAGSYSITGTAAGLKKGFSLAAGVGSYTTTGTAANLKKGRTLAAGVGSYSTTGTAAGLKHGWKVAAGVGSYTTTGTAAGVKHGWKLPAGVGSYTTTGTDAGLKHGWKVAAGVGSYSTTGTDAGLKHGWKVAAGTGSYSMSGTSAGLKMSMLAGVSSYSMSGVAAGLKHGWVLAAGTGSYSTTGTDAGLKHGWKLPAGTGDYATIGTDATLRKGSNKVLAAGEGTYSTTGTDAGVLKGWKVAAGVGSYSTTGTDAGLKHGWNVAAGTGSYDTTGTDAGLKHGWKAAAGIGSYSIIGDDVALTKTSQKILPAGEGTYAMAGQDARVAKGWIIQAGTASYDMVGATADLVYTPGTGVEPSYGGTGVGGDYWKRVPDPFEARRVAREKAAEAFRKARASRVAGRKEAAVRASGAVSELARTLKPMDPQIDQLLELQAYIQGLIEQQDQIEAAQMREAATQWGMIQSEMIAEARREEELMIVMALAL